MGAEYASFGGTSKAPEFDTILAGCTVWSHAS
jgi:hypothetical protein